MSCRRLLLFFCLSVSGILFAETIVERDLARIVRNEREIWERLKQPTSDQTARDADVRRQFIDVQRDYDALIATDPNFVPSLVAYGLFLGKMDERTRSEEILRRADAIDGTLAVVKNQLGNFCAEEAKFAEALTYFQAAVALEPAEPLYHYQLGVLIHEGREFLVKEGKFTDAAAREQSAASLKRASACAPQNLAYGYRYAESFADFLPPRWEEALSVWRSLEALADSPLALQAIQLQQANVLIKLGRFEEAEKLINGVTEPQLEKSRKTLVEELAKRP